MVIHYKKWRITDRISERKMLVYGYMVQERVGEQWKKPTYFPLLSQAVSEVFERTVRSEFRNKQVDLQGSSTNESLVQFAKRLDEIKAEILEACDVR